VLCKERLLRAQPSPCILTQVIYSKPLPQHQGGAHVKRSTTDNVLQSLPIPPLGLTLSLMPYPLRWLCQVDPTLSRTVLVSTKFDTRLPQFSTPSDVEAFLRAPGLANDVQMLGGSPFFT
jgi:hypothetical protein